MKWRARSTLGLAALERLARYRREPANPVIAAALAALSTNDLHLLLGGFDNQAAGKELNSEQAAAVERLHVAAQAALQKAAG